MGYLVLVHHTRFPGWPRNDLDLPYFGQYLVTEVGPSTVRVKASPSMGGFVDVGYSQLKRYTAVEDDALEAWEELAIEAERSKMAADEDENKGGVQEENGVQQLPEMDDDEMKKRRTATSWSRSYSTSTNTGGVFSDDGLSKLATAHGNPSAHSC